MIDDRTPLYSNRIIRNYLEYLSAAYPELDTDDILARADIDRQEVEDKGHWFNHAQLCRFHAVLDAKTHDPNIAREAGRYSSSSKALNPLKQYLLSFMSLSYIYLMLDRLYPRISRAAVLKCQKKGPQKVELIVTPKSGVTEKPFQCENRIGSFESVAKLFTEAFARVEHPECLHRGYKRCRYICTWEKRTSRIWIRIRKYAYFLSGVSTVSILFGIPVIVWITLFLLSLLVVAGLTIGIEKLEKGS